MVIHEVSEDSGASKKWMWSPPRILPERGVTPKPDGCDRLEWEGKAKKKRLYSNPTFTVPDGTKTKNKNGMKSGSRGQKSKQKSSLRFLNKQICRNTNAVGSPKGKKDQNRRQP